VSALRTTGGTSAHVPNRPDREALGRTSIIVQDAAGTVTGAREREAPVTFWRPEPRMVAGARW